VRLEPPPATTADRDAAAGTQPGLLLTMHSSVPGADLSDWDDYEINLDQRVLSPDLCMAACMAGRPAGWR
jgi:hypothetical protein